MKSKMCLFCLCIFYIHLKKWSILVLTKYNQTYLPQNQYQVRKHGVTQDLKFNIAKNHKQTVITNLQCQCVKIYFEQSFL
jgi:hypothetical protein